MGFYSCLVHSGQGHPQKHGFSGRNTVVITDRRCLKKGRPSPTPVLCFAPCFASRLHLPAHDGTCSGSTGLSLATHRSAFPTGDGSAAPVGLASVEHAEHALMAEHAVISDAWHRVAHGRFGPIRFPRGLFVSVLFGQRRNAPRELSTVDQSISDIQQILP